MPSLAAHRLTGDLSPEVLLAGVGLAILLPVVPFTRELLALRRLTATAFGTLMNLEPATALVIGLIVSCPIGERGPGSSATAA